MPPGCGIVIEGRRNAEAAIHIVGLTGGIGSGKSTVATLLRERGYPVVDADHMARQVVGPGQPALTEIAEAFGRDVIGADGRLDRRRLGRIVFADEAARRRLEAITHPRIAKLSMAAFARMAADGETIAFFDHPLLVETGAWRDLARLVVVSAPLAARLERLRTRDPDLSVDDARARIAAQMPLEEKVGVAHYVVPNDSDLATLARRVEALVVWIEEELRG